MKIVQVITTLAYGGAEKVCLDLCNALAGRPEIEQVYLVSLRAHTPEYRPLSAIDPRVEVIFLDKKDGLDPMLFYTLGRLMRKIRPDVVHTHLTALGYLAPSLILRRLKARIVHTVHNVPQKDVPPLFQKFHKLLFRKKMAEPVAISEEIQGMISDYYGVGLPALINNFVPAPRLSPAADDVARELMALKKTAGTKIFLNIGRLNPQKNQLMLIEAFKQKQNEDMVLVIIGGGGGTPDALAKQLYDAASGTGNVFMLGNKSNPLDYLAAADYFILSSLYEGLPIALIEAASLGIIPVSTKVGGVASIIKEGKTGFLAEEITVPGLEAVITKALQQTPGQAAFYQQNLQQLYDESFSLEKALEGYLKCYGLKKY